MQNEQSPNIGNGSLAGSIRTQRLIDYLKGLWQQPHELSSDVLKRLTIRSLDDLVTLSNITFSLRTLSQADSAEEAQNWMYELPVLYSRQLAQEHLVTNLPTQLIVTRSCIS